MTNSALVWTPATENDLPALLSLMRAFYSEDQLVYDEAIASRSASALIADENLGAIFLLRNHAHQALGYVVATLGFSLEFGGRFVLLDELYLLPAARGLGAGQSALKHVESYAASRNIGFVRLEVNHHNTKAYAVYAKAGFTDDKRHLLSKRVA